MPGDKRGRENAHASLMRRVDSTRQSVQTPAILVPELSAQRFLQSRLASGKARWRVDQSSCGKFLHSLFLAVRAWQCCGAARCVLAGQRTRCLDDRSTVARVCTDDASCQPNSGMCVTLRRCGRLLAQHAREAAHLRVVGPAVAAEWRQRLRLTKLAELQSAAALLRGSHEHQMQRHAGIVQVSQLGSERIHPGVAQAQSRR